MTTHGGMPDPRGDGPTGAEKPHEEDDPLELIGVELPVADAKSDLEMAATFAEEFARSGWGEEQIVEMFSNPGYAAPHRVWCEHGPQTVRTIIREAVEIWNPGGLK